MKKEYLIQDCKNYCLMQALVECEGNSIDLSGDMGAVGRIVVSDSSFAKNELCLDLKGMFHSYVLCFSIKGQVYFNICLQMFIYSILVINVEFLYRSFGPRWLISKILVCFAIVGNLPMVSQLRYNL